MSRWTQEIAEALAEYEDDFDEESLEDESPTESEKRKESGTRVAHTNLRKKFISRVSSTGPPGGKEPHRGAPADQAYSGLLLERPAEVMQSSGPSTKGSSSNAHSARLPLVSDKSVNQPSKKGSCATTKRQLLGKAMIPPAMQELARQHMTIVFCGHVDAGKSTLVAQILLQLGQVDAQELRRVEREASQAGKGCFRLAWMLDSEESERAHGVTIDMAIRKAPLSDKSLVMSFLDCPGHRDFITAFLRGAFLADLGVLVVDARPGSLNSSLGQRGQTIQHARILRHIGIDRLLVAVNKLDVNAYDESHFVATRDKLNAALRSELDWADITYIPCSGLTGENVFQPAHNEQLKKWYCQTRYTPLSLLEAIQLSQQTTADARFARLQGPARFAILSADGETLIGSLLSGTLGQGGAIKLWGLDSRPVIRRIERIVVLPENLHEQTLASRQFAALYLSHGPGSRPKSTHDDISMNWVLGTEPDDSAIRQTRRFKARLWGLVADVPVLPGQRLELFTASLWGVTVRLVSLFSDNQGRQGKKLRKLPQNTSSIAEVAFSTETDPRALGRGLVDSDGWSEAPIALASVSRELGCFILRYRETLVASGQVLETY
jgi:translation elongation factor EF-1alpha